jgi:hypothetical protein
MIKKLTQKTILNIRFWTGVLILYLFIVIFFTFFGFNNKSFLPSTNKSINEILSEIIKPTILPLDIEDYDLRLINLANTTTPLEKKLWPASFTLPIDGAILPFRRIIAYYGNFYSKQMGVLGEYPEPEVFRRLNIELQNWNMADPETPAIPAIQYIAITAQGSKGDDGKYKLRMPDSQIDKAIKMAQKIDGLVILDVQVGQSNLKDEVPTLEKYLKMPQVHLAIDPEFAMKKGQVPGAIYIGTFDAVDINYTVDYLAQLVKKYNLPPKILVVHRFTKNMVTNYQNIKTIPEVQIIMNMDGWGTPEGKLATYQSYIYDNPVQFTGFKLFYKNDLRASSTMLTPEELMNLTPRPIYIQYQ